MFFNRLNWNIVKRIVEGVGRRAQSQLPPLEPFRTKMVEHLKLTTVAERRATLAAAHYNLFQVPAAEVLIDLLTDSGTAAMSMEQWAGMLQGDDSYAGSRSWFRFQQVVRDITGFHHVVPTHQGRAAERILFATVCKPHHIVPSNSHFDTTRANIEVLGATAVDLLCAEGKGVAPAPFKGNMDTAALEQLLSHHAPQQGVPLVMVTLTNNTCGGQPVSLQNLRETRRLCSRFGVPLYMDACRFAENAWFIKTREEGQAHRSVKEIAFEMFSLVDGCTMSAKKDGLSNIGGFLCTNDGSLAQREKNLLIITEGFPTYGGLSGRDLEATAVGLQEVLHEDYLRHRIGQIDYFASRLLDHGIPVVRPPGGHAVFIHADQFLPHIPRHHYPGQALVVALYEQAGVRACEIGSVMFGKPAGEEQIEIPSQLELVRLAIPRRVYSQTQLDYVVAALAQIAKNKDQLRGLKIIEASEHLRHFTAKFQPLNIE